MAFTVDTTRTMTGDRMVKGMRVSGVNAVLGATADYSTTTNSEGIDAAPIKTALGLGTIVDVLNCAVRSSTGTLKPITAIFNPTTQRIRLLKGAAEVVPGTDLAAGDLLQLTLFGG